MKAFAYLAPIAPFDYLVPTSVNEALDMLDLYGERARLIAGGTDLTVLLKERLIEPEVIIDMNHLRDELCGIEVIEGRLRIGAMTTFTELEGDIRVQRFARALSEAASDVGTWQIRNMGTIGGNLANGSPAADSAPPLIALSARVHLRDKEGERTVAIEDFFLGPKKTILRLGEIITSVELPISEGVASYWMRAARRNENAISIASVGVAYELRGNKFGTGRISLGAVAPTPIIAKQSSSKLKGSRISSETIEAAAALAQDECEPISDLRASATYRRHLVYVLTKRTVYEATRTRRS